MTFVGPHAIKINRAQALSTTGRYSASFAAMLEAIPLPVVVALTSRQLAALIDANWRLADASKAIATREICDDGFVWDTRRNCSRELTA